MAELKYRFSETDYFKSKEIEIIPRDNQLNGDFWGFLEGEGPKIDNDNPDGQIKYFDEPKVQFENAEQALVSLFYARYSLGQIIPNIEKYRDMTYPKVVRLLEGICKDVDRKEFIDNLRKCPPRRLYDNEYHALKTIMGRMKGNTRSDKMNYIRKLIENQINDGFEIKERKTELNNRIKKEESLSNKIKRYEDKKVELYKEIDNRTKKLKEKLIELNNEIDRVKMKVEEKKKELYVEIYSIDDKLKEMENELNNMGINSEIN